MTTTKLNINLIMNMNSNTFEIWSVKINDKYAQGLNKALLAQYAANNCRKNIKKLLLDDYGIKAERLAVKFICCGSHN